MGFHTHSGVAMVGGGDFKLVMIVGGLRRSSASLTLGPFGLATLALRGHQPNWIQTTLAPPPRRDQPDCLD